MGRMQRYEYSSDDNRRKSRLERNQELYHDLGPIEKSTTFADIPKIEAVELNAAKKNYRTRQGYHQIKDYGIIEEKPKVQKELDEFNYLYRNDDKPHDINMILEEAKKLRERDELERKRKLHNEKYNILESSEEEINKFKEEKNKKIKPVDNEEELEELIHTITSKELREQIDEEEGGSLLSDLMATNVNDEVSKAIAAKAEEEQAAPIEKTANNIMKDMDKSFYTRSMDLNIDDFDSDEEEDAKVPAGIVFLRILFSILLIAAVGFGVYYVITNF